MTDNHKSFKIIKLITISEKNQFFRLFAIGAVEIRGTPRSIQMKTTPTSFFFEKVEIYESVWMLTISTIMLENFSIYNISMHILMILTVHKYTKTLLRVYKLAFISSRPAPPPRPNSFPSRPRVVWVLSLSSLVVWCGYGLFPRSLGCGVVWVGSFGSFFSYNVVWVK